MPEIVEFLTNAVIFSVWIIYSYQASCSSTIIRLELGWKNYIMFYMFNQN